MANPKSLPIFTKDGISYRECSKCHQVYPVEFFHKERSKKTTGLSSWCKSCTLEVHTRYYNQVTDKGNYRRLRDEQNKKKRRDDPKNVARRILGEAVRTGKIIKPEICQRCGKQVLPRELHAHHKDYSIPLDVVWLCAPCHGKEHRDKCRPPAV